MVRYFTAASLGYSALHRDGAAAKWLLISLAIVGGIILLGITISLIVGHLRKSRDVLESPGERQLLEATIKRRQERYGSGRPSGETTPDEPEKEKKNKEEPEE
jgi:hypothetical protein